MMTTEMIIGLWLAGSVVVLLPSGFYMLDVLQKNGQQVRNCKLFGMVSCAGRYWRLVQHQKTPMFPLLVFVLGLVAMVALAVWLVSMA